MFAPVTVGLVPVMLHPASGVPVLIVRTQLKRTFYGHTYTMCDAFWGEQGEDLAAATGQACEAFGHTASGIELLHAPSHLATDLLRGNHLARVSTATTALYFVLAKWRTVFVPRVSAPAFEGHFISAVHGYTDAHGKGRCYGVDITVPGRAATTQAGFRFVPLDEDHIQCMTILQVAAAAVQETSHKPYLPHGVFHMVSPSLHAAVQSLSAAMVTSARS